jgi:hypothetical protein
MRSLLFLAFAAAATGQLASSEFVPREFSAVVRGTVAQDVAATPKAGWVYIVGSTTSPDYPVTADAFDRTCGTDGACNPVQGRFGISRTADVVLTLVDSSGRIEYSTFLGGASQDDNPRIAVTSDGTVWLAGATSSASFEGFGGSCSGSFWIARFDFTLRHLQDLRCLPWSLGLADIAVDAQQRLWVLGTIGTPGAATANAYQRQLAGQLDLFVARFSADATAPQYATYLGGSGLDTAAALVVAPSGAVALTGRTNSQDFPVVRAFTPTRHETTVTDGDAVVTVLDTGGQALQFSTYFGGSRDETGGGVAVDDAGNVFVTGATRSGDMPVTVGASDTRCGGDGACNGSFDAFIAKFSPTGSLLASTFLGGGDLDMGRAIAITRSGRIGALGTTQSADFPLTEPSASGRTPGVNVEHTYLALFDDGLMTQTRAMFVADQQYVPNVSVLTARQGFAFVAGQVTQSTGMASGFGTYVRAVPLP